VLPKDSTALAKAVIRVLNDKEFAGTMGLSARKKVEQEFPVDRLAPRKPRPLRRGQGELYKMFIFLTGKPRLLRRGASKNGFRN
jgi:glycosyltransferase involved in cell wall biosynthesis